MPANSTPEPDRRLATVEGLREAGVLASFAFDEVTGLAGVAYTPEWIRILRSGLLLIADPGYAAAIMIDDPVALRMWITRFAAALPTDDTRADQPVRPASHRARRPR